MKVLILGGGGVIGQKLAQSLALRGELRGKELTKIVLADITNPAPIDAPFAVETTTCDIANPASVSSCIDADTDVIYVLAAIVS